MENILIDFISLSIIIFLFICLTVFAFLGFSIIKEELKK
jgi:hypothetical protein